MKTTDFKTVKTPLSIQKCLEYANGPSENNAENVQKLQELIEQIEVSVKFDGIRKYWPDDKEERLTGTFKIERNKESKNNKRVISFSFGFSIADTQMMEYARPTTPAKQRTKEEFYNGLLYSCLSCCGMEYHCPKSFADFCGEFGYDTDSRKAETLHRNCLEQSALLERIFTEDEVQYLPS